ncbi:MAG: hypothetical protein AAFP78_09560, partial [Pseudomonadota bacterium]
MELFVYAALTLQTSIIIFLVLRLAVWRRRAKSLDRPPATFLPPSVLESDPLMPVLAQRAVNRLPRQTQTDDLLPPTDFDIETAFETRIAAIPPSGEAAPRRAFADHAVNLRARLAGHREIEFLNALSISYLRRRTARVDHAKEIFFRIWDEKGDALVADLSTRWLISTLMTFADHGRSEDERICGALGYLYGAMLAASETERCYWPDGAAPEIELTTPDTERFGLNGSFPFELGGNDHLTNLNAFVYSYALRPTTPGPLLERLMMRARYSDTYFSRFDSARRRLN